MELLRRFASDEAGFIASAELVLIATIVVIGLVVGLVALRNQVVQELVDVGQAIGSLSQSFCFSGVDDQCGTAWTDATCYVDLIDFCQAPQTPGDEPGGISVRLFPAGFPTTPPGGERSF